MHGQACASYWLTCGAFQGQKAPGRTPPEHSPVGAGGAVVHVRGKRVGDVVHSDVDYRISVVDETQVGVAPCWRAHGRHLELALEVRAEAVWGQRPRGARVRPDHATLVQVACQLALTLNVPTPEFGGASAVVGDAVLCPRCAAARAP
eukprot:360771-Chlamydomonas_euryale.AAC.5